MKKQSDPLRYISHYPSPLGGILLAAGETGLAGLWFEGAKYYAAGLSALCEEKATPVLERAKEWLAIYFSGRNPDFLPPLQMEGTPFELAVWKILTKIPYGETTTYGQIAAKIAEERGIPKMSARAVGAAVGRNKISIIIPCHRVIGKDGGLTGYAGGVDKKAELLALEQTEGQTT